MSFKTNVASGIAISAIASFVLFAADTSGAAAPVLDDPATTVAYPLPQFVEEPVVQPVPAAPEQPEAPLAGSEPPIHSDADTSEDITGAPDGRFNTLNALVAATSHSGDLSREMQCLAGAIYFESKGESLAGQLAVGRVVINRSTSGRFPSSYCGVVYQRSQFSFVRGNAMPAINRGSRDWANAVKIAKIAHDNAWPSQVEGALFFHARYVSPGWRLRRVGTIDNHVFYR